VSSDERYEKAKKIAREKADVVRFVVIYILIIVFLAIVNNVTDSGGYQWWLWPALGLGVVLVYRVVTVFVIRDLDLESRLVQRELDRMKGDEKPEE
jgi:hypothetical protein